MKKPFRVVCSCGLSYQLSGERSQKKPQCPVCGRALKEPPPPPDDLDLPSPVWNRVKIGIGIGSVVGLATLAIVIIFISRRTVDPTPPNSMPESAKAKPTPIPPLQTDTTSEPLVIPVGRIAGEGP